MPKPAPIDAGPPPTAHVEVNGHLFRYAQIRNYQQGEGKQVVLTEDLSGCYSGDPLGSLSFVLWNGPPSGYSGAVPVDAQWNQNGAPPLSIRFRVAKDQITGDTAKGSFEPTNCTNDAGTHFVPPELGATTKLTIDRPNDKPYVKPSGKSVLYLDLPTGRLEFVRVELIGHHSPLLSLDLVGARLRTERDLMLTPQPIAVRFVDYVLHGESVQFGHGWIRFLEIGYERNARFRAEVGVVIPDNARMTGIIEGVVESTPM